MDETVRLLTGSAVDFKAIDNKDNTYALSVGAKSDNPLNAKITDFAGKSPFTTVFGELVVGTKQNNINVPFLRSTGLGGVTEYLRTVKDERGATDATGNAIFENETVYVRAGAGIADYEYFSKAINRYQTGHENIVFHTMVFDEPEVGRDCGIGYGRKAVDYIGFGYNGTTFGIWLILRGIRTHIPQSSWNVNTLEDGDFILDPQKENISGTSFGWLGVADILFYINASDDNWILVHRHRTANVDNKPHLSDPNQPICAFVERLSGTGSDGGVGTSSWYAGTVGERALGTGSDKTPLVQRDAVTIPAGAETVLLSIRNRTTFQGKTNSVRVRYGTLTLVTDGNKSVRFKVYLNGVTGGTWDFFDEELSVTEIAIDTTLNTTSRVIDGITKIDEQIGSTALAKSDRTRINLFDSDIIISALPGETITLTAQSANTSDIDIQLRMIEEF